MQGAIGLMVESGEHDRRGSIRLENLSGVQRLVGAGHGAQGMEHKVQRHIEGRVGCWVQGMLRVGGGTIEVEDGLMVIGVELAY